MWLAKAAQRLTEVHVPELINFPAGAKKSAIGADFSANLATRPNFPVVVQVPK
jgi:hypothetical protein